MLFMFILDMTAMFLILDIIYTALSSVLYSSQLMFIQVHFLKFMVHVYLRTCMIHVSQVSQSVFMCSQLYDRLE
jgi:hypothetical protein